LTARHPNQFDSLSGKRLLHLFSKRVSGISVQILVSEDKGQFLKDRWNEIFPFVIFAQCTELNLSKRFETKLEINAKGFSRIFKSRTLLAFKLLTWVFKF
jgi:hypothetical protein